MSETFDAKKTAVLLMDYQVAILQNVTQSNPELIAKAKELLKLARQSGAMVLHICVAFREGYPEISPRNLSFGQIKTTGRFVIGSPGTEIHPDVVAQNGELIIYKKRVSAFAGSDLEMVLTANGIENLILAGVATSGVVLSTTRSAADLDYRLTIVSDCCADGDAEVHRVLTEKVFPRQAKVIKLSEVKSLLGIS